MPLVAAGVGAYLVWQLLPLCCASVASLLRRCRGFTAAAPTQSCKAAKGEWKEGAPADSEDEAPDHNSRLEPDAEPASPSSCTAPVRRASFQCWTCIFGFALAIAFFSCLCWGTGGPPNARFDEDEAPTRKAAASERGGPMQVEPVQSIRAEAAVSTSDNQVEEHSKEVAPVAAAMLPEPEIAGGYEVSAESVDASTQHGEEKCISGKPALTVKLTRLVGMEDGFEKSDYYGTLHVGTPALAMTVAFDTGSGHLILPSMYCKNAGCKKHVRYKRSASRTGRDIQFNGTTVEKGQPRDSITVEFGSGTASGVAIEDVICMGPKTNASVANEVWADSEKKGLEPGCVRMNFLAATHMSDDPFATFDFDGIMGLSLPGLSQTPRLNFMHMLSKMLTEDHQSCSSQAFGVFLACNNAEDSEIAFGGWDEGHLNEELSWSDVENPSRGHWILPIKGLRIDQEPLSFCDDGSCIAAVDTGTALLSVPTFAFKRIFSLLRHDADLAGHCQGFGPMLHFEFEEFSISLGPKEYSAPREKRFRTQQVDTLYENAEVEVTPRRTDLRCFPMLMTLDEENLGGKLFLLGEPILRKYYTVYDGLKKRVGFGRASHVVAPTRDELLMQAPELDKVYSQSAKQGLSQPRRRAIPTMFDMFRWRRQLRQPPAMFLTQE